MKPSMVGGLWAASVVGWTSAAGTPDVIPRSSTVTPITVEGNAFFQGSERFYIRGVDYAPGNGIGTPLDPIADAAGCTRDIPYFTKLGINTIRVYTIDNSASHDQCMQALEAAGIYIVIDTDNAQYSLNRDNPKESYNSVFLQSVFATMDEFANYPNTLGFLSGNEVINNADNTDAAPYIKATIRDMKNYLKSQSYRQIPIGYSAADVDANQQLLAEYLNCGTSAGSASLTDFYSINDYSWCDPSSFQTSGWDTLVANYSSYGLPLFMSEYGCIANTRDFQEVGTLYSTSMTGVFSGGLVYEYSEEGNGYGLVSISGNTVTPNSQFTSLQNAFKNTPNPSGDGGATTTASTSTCPPQSAEWNVANDDLPAMPAAAEAFFKSGAGKGPGLVGAGSQNAGNSENESSGTVSAGATATGISSSSSTGTGKSAGTQVRLDFSVLSVASLGLVAVIALL